MPPSVPRTESRPGCSVVSASKNPEYFRSGIAGAVSNGQQTAWRQPFAEGCDDLGGVFAVHHVMQHTDGGDRDWFVEIDQGLQLIEDVVGTANVTQ